MQLGPGETEASPWRVEPFGEFARRLAAAAGTPANRPRIIAVDGRGGSGKTTLANRLAEALPPAAVVHSDDIAWNHSRFGWDDPMITGVLEPLRAGGPVHYQPPGWLTHGRDGQVDVRDGLSTVLLEGVGVSRRSLTPLLDATIWVQSDYVEARRRGLHRDMLETGWDDETALREWLEWEAEEVPFLLDDRPWARAQFIVGSTQPAPGDAVAVGRPLAG
jgi:uridine kinase